MIACYVRVSTDKQKTDSQESELTAYAARYDKPFTLYKDVISGKTKNRPALDEMLKDCRSGKITKILCYKIDRLGRSIINLKELLNEFELMNIPVIFTSQSITTENSNPAGKLFISMLGVFAEFERETICERVRAGIASRMAQGLPMGRTPTQEAVKEKIRSLRQTKLSMAKIAKELKIGVATVHKVLNAQTQH